MATPDFSSFRPCRLPAEYVVEVEVPAILGRSLSTVRRWRDLGRMPDKQRVTCDGFALGAYWRLDDIQQLAARLQAEKAARKNTPTP